MIAIQSSLKGLRKLLLNEPAIYRDLDNCWSVVADPENRKNESLYTVFKENFPITDTRNNFVLEFLDYFIDPPRYTIDECLEQGLTYGCLLYTSSILFAIFPFTFILYQN